VGGLTFVSSCETRLRGKIWNFRWLQGVKLENPWGSYMCDIIISSSFNAGVASPDSNEFILPGPPGRLPVASLL